MGGHGVIRKYLVLLALVLAPRTGAADTGASALAEAQAAFLAGDHAAALQVIEPAARAGEPLAQALLATAYDTGQGKPQSAQAARDWMTRAAGQDYAPAAFALGLMWLEGRDEMPADPEAATLWLGRAMALGHPEAFHIRARLMLAGLGGPANPPAAAALALTALELGVPEAGMLLAEMYLDGDGVAQDPARARATYARAAQMGHAPALARLAVMYELGQGGPADPVAAFTLYQEAVSLGDASAAINLALFLTDQDGYWSDPVLGMAYCLWGVSRAPEDLRDSFAENCDALAQNLTPDQRGAADRIAATF